MLLHVRLFAKNIFLTNIITFQSSHFGYLAKSVDPDEPASEEAGSSGSILFQAVYDMLHNLKIG